MNEEYFNWLIAKIGVDTGPEGHDILCSILHEAVFYPLLEMDDNRWEDGMEYRNTYASLVGGDADILNRALGGCTMLELMVSLSEHMSFDMQDSIFEAGPAKWFKELLANAGLYIYTNDVILADTDAYYQICDIVERIVFRRYDYNGEGGFFPLSNPEEDQRQEELEVQRNCYLMENYNIFQ